MVIPRPLPQAHRPAPPTTVAPSRPLAFPPPMNYSFSQPMPQAHPPMRTTSRSGPATLDFSLAPRQGATDVSPFSRVAGAHVGPDWRNELSAWVRRHAYYPEQAVMNGEDGNVTVQVVADPNGHVTSVEMASRSGSQWLDMALMGLFRDANLPPLLDENQPITFNFTMHYILIRTR
jgi:protein TonB